MSRISLRGLRMSLSDSLKAARLELSRLFATPFRKRPKILDDDEVKKETEWYRGFKPDSRVDYSIVLEHARKKYEELVAVSAAIDKKAEWIFALSTAAVYAVFAFAQTNHVHLAVGIPSFAFLGLALLG